MNTDFVYGFLQALDGERDPRILLLGFRQVPVITQNFSLGRFTEDLFEVLACYYPITFSPKPDDPTGITKQDLVKALQ